MRNREMRDQMRDEMRDQAMGETMRDIDATGPRHRGGGRHRGGEGYGQAGVHGGPPWEGRGRMRRGDIRTALLAALAEGPGHGYDVMQTLEDKTGGAWRPSPGSVYPTLQLLEDEGLVQSAERDGKRVFEINDTGRTELARRIEAAGDLRGSSRAGTRRSGNDAAARCSSCSLREAGHGRRRSRADRAGDGDRPRRPEEAVPAPRRRLTRDPGHLIRVLPRARLTVDRPRFNMRQDGPPRARSDSRGRGTNQGYAPTNLELDGRSLVVTSVVGSILSSSAGRSSSCWSPPAVWLRATRARRDDQHLPLTRHRRRAQSVTALAG